MLEKDQIIGRNYRVVNRLGTGGMGQVYRATDLNLGRDVAVKFIAPEAAQDQELTKRFLNEGRILATIRHRAVIDIYASDVDEQLNTPFLVMELVDGQSLEQLRDELHKDLPRTLGLVIELLEGIHACHQKGIIHRDLKPANILINRDGQLKILDFGIAKTAKKVTRTGVSMGTPHYMSPEQCLGKGEITDRSDVYSIGIMLWEFITNKLPFDVGREADDPGLAIALKHLSEPLPMLDLEKVQNGLRFQELLKGMLAKKPEERPSVPETIESLKRELARLSRSTAKGQAVAELIGEIYRIDKEIGSGGMGKVYRALDTSLNRTVAIKVLNETLSADETIVERFIKEGQLLATVGHPNVLNIYASAREKQTGQTFLVMEYIDGKLLSELKPALIQDPRQIAPLMLQLCEGLQACHNKGIIHRDLKPSNLMVTRDGLLKIFDFGIAKTAQALTRTGTTVGTPMYMSPEQCVGSREITGQSDIYSLGVICWELIYGEPPYKADDESNPELAIAMKHVQATLPMVALPKAELFLPLVPLVRKMLDKDPKARPTLDELIETLEAFVTQTAGEAASESSGKRRRDSLRRSNVKTLFDVPEAASGWGKKFVAVALFLALAAGGWWFSARPGASTDQQSLVLSKKITESIRVGNLDQAASDVQALAGRPETALVAQTFKVTLSVEFERRARIALADGQASQARELLEKALTNDPENASAAQELADLKNVDLQRSKLEEKRNKRMTTARLLLEHLAPASGTDELAALLEECRNDEQASFAAEIWGSWIEKFRKDGEAALAKDPSLSLKYFEELQNRLGEAPELDSAIALARTKVAEQEKLLGENRDLASASAEIEGHIARFTGDADPTALVELVNRYSAVAGTTPADRFRQEISAKIASEAEKLATRDRAGGLALYKRASGIFPELPGIKDRIRLTEEALDAEKSAVERADRERAFLASLDERLAKVRPGDDPIPLLADLARLSSEFGKVEFASSRRNALFEAYHAPALELRKTDPLTGLKLLGQCRAILPERVDVVSEIAEFEKSAKTATPAPTPKEDLPAQARKLAKKPLAKGANRLPGLLVDLEKSGNATLAQSLRLEIATALQKQGETAPSFAEASTALNGILKFFPSGHSKRPEMEALVKTALDKRKKKMLDDVETVVSAFQPVPQPKALVSRLNGVSKAGEDEAVKRFINTLKPRYLEAAKAVEASNPKKAMELLKGLQSLPTLASDPEVTAAIKELKARKGVAEPAPELPSPATAKPEPEQADGEETTSETPLSPGDTEEVAYPPGEAGDVMTQLDDLTDPSRVVANQAKILELCSRLEKLKQKEAAQGFRRRTVNALVEIADENTAQGAFDEAIRIHQIALKIIPNHPDALKGLRLAKGKISGDNEPSESNPGEATEETP